MVETFVLSWSGDKDSAMAFRELSHDPRYKIQSLRGVGFAHQFTSINYPTAELLQVVLSSLHWFALTVKKRQDDCGKGFRYLSRG